PSAKPARLLVVQAGESRHGIQVVQLGDADRSPPYARALGHRRGLTHGQQPAQGRGASLPPEQTVLLPVLRVHRAEESRGDIQDGVRIEVAVAARAAEKQTPEQTAFGKNKRPACRAFTLAVRFRDES